MIEIFFVVNVRRQDGVAEIFRGTVVSQNVGMIEDMSAVKMIAGLLIGPTANVSGRLTAPAETKFRQDLSLGLQMSLSIAPMREVNHHKHHLSIQLDSR